MINKDTTVPVLMAQFITAIIYFCVYKEGRDFKLVICVYNLI